METPTRMQNQHTNMVDPERKKRFPFSMVKSWNTKTTREITQKMMERIMKACTALRASSSPYVRVSLQSPFVQFFQSPTEDATSFETIQTLEMVETKSIIAAAMCTTKIPASNTSILAVQWLGSREFWRVRRLRQMP